MPVTFPVSNTKPVEPKVQLISPQTSIKDNLGITVEACGSEYDQLLGGVQDHWNGSQRMSGFLQAIHHSFDCHAPLILSPDDVWVTIAQGFSYYVNANAESLRKHFVKHEGQEYIEIQRDHFIKGSPDNDWMGGFNEFSDKIAEHIGKARELLVSDYSTTTAISRAASQVVLMDAMKSYFSYGCRTCCGIPNITLEGTQDDWEHMVDQAQALAKYRCKDWVQVLVTALKRFVDAFKGNADPKVWQSLYHEGGGSGGPFVTGWVNVFFPYTKSYQGTCTRTNEYALTLEAGRGFFSGPCTSDIPSGMSAVPFKWIYHNEKYLMKFIGGFLGAYLSPTGSVRPAFGWAVAEETNTGEATP
jgi:Domain of unknown function (DUF4419)